MTGITSKRVFVDRITVGNGMIKPSVRLAPRPTSLRHRRTEYRKRTSRGGRLRPESQSTLTAHKPDDAAAVRANQHRREGAVSTRRIAVAVRLVSKIPHKALTVLKSMTLYLAARGLNMLWGIKRSLAYRLARVSGLNFDHCWIKTASSHERYETCPRSNIQ